MASTTLSRLPRCILGNIYQFRLPSAATFPTTTRRGLVVACRHSSSTKAPDDGKSLAWTNKAQSNPKINRNQNLPTEAVFYHPHHDMYICWHPEVPFPYEMSKPLPIEAHGTESSLKTDSFSLMPVKEVFRKKDERLVQRELMKLTYTPQYGWRGKHMGRKIKDVKCSLDPLKQRRDREYL